jgi:hypothetical protein
VRASAHAAVEGYRTARELVNPPMIIDKRSAMYAVEDWPTFRIVAANRQLFGTRRPHSVSPVRTHFPADLWLGTIVFVEMVLLKDI